VRWKAPCSTRETAAAGFLLFPSGGRPSGQHTQLALFVDDIAATVAQLKGRGVEFQDYDFPGLKTTGGIADLGYEKSAWFHDSEGNLLALGELT
jgi:predicted enzyme related to lactoylglutathione lyase